MIIATRADYVLEEPKGNVYVEEIREVHLYHEEWRLITGINLTTTEQRLQASLIFAEIACGASCAPKEEQGLVKGKCY